MNDRDRNRLAMYHASLRVLHTTANEPIWLNQPPPIFASRVAAAEAKVAEIEAIQQAQSADITGVAANKDKEEKDVEDLGILWGCTVAMLLRDRGDLANAQQLDLTPSQWRKISEQELLNTARLLRDQTQTLIDTAPAAELDLYAVNAAVVASLTSEIDEFAAALADPQVAIATRRAQTLALRPLFGEATALFGDLDKLILHYGGTPAGSALIAAFNTARNIIDRHGPGSGGNGGGGNGGGGNGGGGNGGGGNGGDGDVAPTALEIDQLTQNGANIDVSYIAGGGSGADTLQLFWQVDTVDPGFDNFADVVQPQQSVGPFNPGDLIRFKTRAGNVAGETESTVQEITLV